VERVRLRFTRDLEVGFIDRDRALGQVVELAERGTRFPIIIYGPEGCGKTAFLRQAGALLKGRGYHVVLASPLARDVQEVLWYTPSIGEVAREVLRMFPEPYSRIADVAINVASMAMRRLGRPRLAVLVDDIFQAVGLERAELYVKALLNLIEYPPAEYENIVIMVSSSEGATRDRIGRHRWATMRIMWNMDKRGFEELYRNIPGAKPGFEHIWRWAGGNPSMLAKLYELGWDVGEVVRDLSRSKNLRLFVLTLSKGERDLLAEALENVDALIERLGEEEAQRLREKLIECNLVTELWDRDERAWIDTPPPERDLELGIGSYYAWQTPLHREAVRRTLQGLG